MSIVSNATELSSPTLYLESESESEKHLFDHGKHVQLQMYTVETEMVRETIIKAIRPLACRPP